jgi:hypothetical protein
MLNWGMSMIGLSHNNGALQPRGLTQWFSLAVHQS